MGEDKDIRDKMREEKKLEIKLTLYVRDSKSSQVALET